MRNTLMALAISILAVPAGAADIKLVTGDDYAPFTDQNLPGGGLATELVTAAFAAMDKTTSLEWLPWRRGYEATRAGSFDATFPYVPTDARQADFLYSAPIYTIRQVAVSAGDTPLDYEGPESLEGKRLCSAIGYALPAPIAPLVESGAVTVQEPAEVTSCPLLVQAGRVDLFVLDAPTARSTITAAGLDPGDFAFADRPVAESSLHLIVSRQHPRGAEIMAAFERGLRSVREAGQWQTLVDAHMATH